MANKIFTVSVSEYTSRRLDAATAEGKTVARGFSRQALVDALVASTSTEDLNGLARALAGDRAFTPRGRPRLAEGTREARERAECDAYMARFRAACDEGHILRGRRPAGLTADENEEIATLTAGVTATRAADRPTREPRPDAAERERAACEAYMERFRAAHGEGRILRGRRPLGLTSAELEEIATLTAARGTTPDAEPVTVDCVADAGPTPDAEPCAEPVTVDCAGGPEPTPDAEPTPKPKRKRNRKSAAASAEADAEPTPDAETASE